MGYSSLNAENNRGVTNYFIFAWSHEKINILLSVLRIFFSFLLSTRVRTSIARTLILLLLILCLCEEYIFTTLLIVSQ